MKHKRFEIFGQQALFIDSSYIYYIYIPRGMPKLYEYDLRHGDDDSYPCTLELPRVRVNRFGTILAATPLLCEAVASRSVGDDDWTYRSDLADCTIEEFLAEIHTSKQRGEPQ